MKLIKQKAIIMVYLIVSLTFFTSFVLAQETPQNVCCEKTLDNKLCQFTSQENCASGKQDPVPCEQAIYCQLLGCCYEENTGQCFKTTTEATCNALSNTTWDPNPDCDIPECVKNCCVLGSECSLTTEKQCENKYNAYQDIEMRWEIVRSDMECANICIQAEKGCCSKLDQTCDYTTRSLCSTQGLEVTEQGYGFFPNQACSSLEFCSCKSKSYKSCLGDDVYWFDSCDNPEEIAEDCDYDSGTICIKKGNDTSCKSLDCETTSDSPNIDYDNVFRKNGESWCDYDGRVGPSNDLVGSRHYRRMCINGQELVEECRDFREEFCVQGEIELQTGIYSKADCLENRWWDCATTCNQAQPGKNYNKDIELDRQCCQNTTERDCIWWGSGGSDPLITEKEIEEALKENSPGIKKLKCTEEQRREVLCSAINPQDRDGDGIPNSKDDDNDNDGMKDCTSTYLEPGCDKNISPIMCYQDVTVKTKCSEQTSGKSKGGKCVPLVPPGFAFWPDPENIEYTPLIGSGEDICNIANTECTVLWERKKSGGSCKTKGCIQNCHCLTDPWIQSTNDYCRALGDCGAHYNVIGDLTTGGYFEDAPGGPIENLVGAFQEWNNAGQGLFLEEVDMSSESSGILMGIASLLMLIGGILIMLGMLPIGLPLLIIGIIIMLYTMLFGDCPPKSETYHVRCSTWEQPTTNKCELCKQEYKICDEYRCKSLGKNCQIINREDPILTDCVETKPTDISPPIISPDENLAQEKGYIISQTPNSFTITNPLPPYRAVKLGIQTNEPAKCKLHDNRTNSYDEMPTTFIGGPTYKVYHNTSLQLLDGKSYSYFIKCQDIQQNKNLLDYEIKFTIQRGPDLTPPIIEFTNPPSNSFVKSDTAELEVRIYVDEYALFNESEETDLTIQGDDDSILINEPGCRWDFTPKAYEEMQNYFICSQQKDITYNLNECKTLLTDIRDLTTNYYFVCRDLAKNQNQPYHYKLTGSRELKITLTEPSGDIYTENTTLLAVTTDGSQYGLANCRFSTKDQSYSSMSNFLNTNSTLHTQPLTLNQGTYSYFIKCRDSADNEANSIVKFKSKIDKSPPEIIEIFKDSVLIHITTSEPSTCEFSNTTFNYGEGIQMIGREIKQHSAPLQYPLYIICKDLYSNIMSRPIIIYPE